MTHAWVMHGAHLGRAFLFLDILAEYTSLSMTFMVTPFVWYVVGISWRYPMSSFLKPLLHTPLLANADTRSGNSRTKIKEQKIRTQIRRFRPFRQKPLFLAGGQRHGLPKAP